MNRRRRTRRWLLLVPGTLLLVGAQAQDTLRLARFSVHGGGGLAEGENVELRVAIGEAERSLPLGSASYVWRAGVFAELPPARLFSDGFE